MITEERNDRTGSYKVICKWEDHLQSKPMDYEIPSGRRGVVHIFNNHEFKNEQNNFESGHNDGKKIMEVFQKLDYKVKHWMNLTKLQTDEAFDSIVRTEGLWNENALIVFVLSHGMDEFNFLSSDELTINLREKMDMFRKDNCESLAYKPKVFLSDFCHGKKDQRGVGPYLSKTANIEDGKQYFGKEEVLTETLYVMASPPGITAVTNSTGSALTLEICDMLKHDIYQKQVLDNQWFQKLNKRLRSKKCPNTVRTIYDPFPGQLFHPEGFSFGYDIAKFFDHINHKKSNP
ncbi:unnamed protein product, partial [Meganyctiphanes norvegica]